jgi:hypothetical protein
MAEHFTTVYNYINRHATVQQALQDERERMIDTAESALYVALSKQEAWAVSLVLKTIGKNRGYVERHEVTGKDGENLKVEYVNDWRNAE